MFESLHFLYMPSRDVAADAAYFTDVLAASWSLRSRSGRLGSPWCGCRTRPRISSSRTTSRESDRILIYRVADLEATMSRLESDGWEREGIFEIPQGPCCSFHTGGGHRLAIYQPTRPEVTSHFTGRRDF